MEHTQGPWIVDDSIDGEVSVIAPWSEHVKPANTNLFGDYRGGHICKIDYVQRVPTKEQAIANAALIAIAPEMLDALIAIQETINPANDETVVDLVAMNTMISDIFARLANEAGLQ